MPVSPIANVNQPQAAPNTTPAAAPGFAEALAAQLGPTGQTRPDQPVTLGQMVAFHAATPATEHPGIAQAIANGGLMGAGAMAPSSSGMSAAAAPHAGGPIIQAAQQYLGVPYKWGGTNPATGLDCSGFTQRVFADLGIKIPRVSADQSRAGQAVGSLAEARPGDLVYWKGQNGRPNHIGIYLGDGQMMHAPRTGDVVKVGPVRSAPPTTIRRIV